MNFKLNLFNNYLRKVLSVKNWVKVLKYINNYEKY